MPIADAKTEDERRVNLVNEHMRLENAYDFPACIGKFGRPQYEIMADGELFQGAARVNDFLSENLRAFPDFVFQPTRVVPTTNAVLVEGVFNGTHDGPWRGLPATGRRVSFPMCLIFEFDGQAMVNERVYFDVGTPLRQLGVADDPNSIKGKIVTVLAHPVTIIRAILRNIWLRVARRGS